MNWDRVQGNWKQFTGKVKEQWGQLTDDDLTQRSMATANSSRAKYRLAMATPKTKSRRTWTTG